MPNISYNSFQILVNSSCLKEFSNIVVLNDLKSLSTKIMSNIVYCECWVVIWFFSIPSSFDFFKNLEKEKLSIMIFWKISESKHLWFLYFEIIQNKKLSSELGFSKSLQWIVLWFSWNNWQRTNSFTITYIKNVIPWLILINYINNFLYVSKVCMHFFILFCICTLLKNLLSFTCMWDMSSSIFLSIIS